jgi:hypothetical protein
VPLLDIVSGISWAVPFAVGVFALRRLQTGTRVLLGYFLLLGLVEAIGLYLALNKISNLWLFHVFTPLEYGFLTLVFSCWQKKPLLRLLLRLSIPLFALICLLNKLYLEDVSRFDNFTATLESAALILISVYTLFDLYRETASALFRDPRFWIAVAVLVYFSGNLPVFAFANIITLWSMHHFLNITSNILFTGGFLCHRLT